MTLAELNMALQSIPDFTGKLAYRAFPVGKAPKLPFICYLATETDNFKADNRVWKVLQNVDVELYTAIKAPTTEALVEDKLTECGFVWDKYEEYIESENCYQITYSITL